MRDQNSREEKRRGEEEEEEEWEEKKKRREEEREEISGMDTCFGLYGATLDIRISCLAFDISRVLLGFHPNPRFLENRVGKTLNGTR